MGREIFVGELVQGLWDYKLCLVKVGGKAYPRLPYISLPSLLPVILLTQRQLREY